MKLTRYSDYALRICLYLALNPDRVVPIPEIAETYRIPKGNVMKLATDLVGAGFVVSVRGRGGGLKLALPQKSITVGKIVRHTEGEQALVDCSNCVLAPNCGLICILREAQQALFAVLDRYTLADVAAQSPGALRSVIEDFEA